MTYTVETEQETDGRWIAEVVEVPGAMQYGDTRADAIARALRVAADCMERGQAPPE